MKDLNLNDPTQKAHIQNVLRQGAQSEFWQILCQRLKTSLEALQSQLDNPQLSALPAEEYKVMVEILKKQKLDRQDLLELPADLVRELDNPEFFAREREEEVYAEAKDFAK